MVLYEYRKRMNSKRNEKWRKDNLIMFSYVINTTKFPTLRAKARKLEELGIPTLSGRKSWDVRNVHKLSKSLREQGFIK